jgi:succinoglycan biosynthesis protein ExoM
MENSMENALKSIAVCVCTCQRPQMLADCLASLVKLDPIEGVRSEIIVVDNEAEGSEPVQGCARTFGAHYHHQPDRGIPQARNAALDAAREIGATHLAFIDDDEIADSVWLRNLWEAMQHYGAGAIQGYVEYRYPEGTQEWRKRGEYTTRKRNTGHSLKLAATNNLLIDLSAANGLRFDESLRFLGGEDAIFTDQIHKRGHAIVFCLEAVTFETVPQARVTIAAHTKKAFRKGFCAVHEAKLMGRPSRASVWRLIRRLTTGSAKLAVSPLCLIAGSNFALHTVMSGARQLAFVAGAVSSHLGKKTFDYYQNPTGF